MRKGITPVGTTGFVNSIPRIPTKPPAATPVPYCQPVPVGRVVSAYPGTADSSTADSCTTNCGSTNCGSTNCSAHHQTANPSTANGCTAEAHHYAAPQRAMH